MTCLIVLLAVSAPSLFGAGTYTVSGTIKVGSVGMQGVPVSMNGGATTTDANGNYSFTVAAGSSYTVQPTMLYCSFSPYQSSFANISSNQTFNFTATPQVSAYITNLTHGGSTLFYLNDTWQLVVYGPPGQPVTYTSQHNGQSLPPQAPGPTNANGMYIVNGTMTGSGLVGTWEETWAVDGVAAAPLNFTVSSGLVTIGGTVTAGASPLAGATVVLSGTQGGSTTTNSSGAYSFSVASGGGYTVTPSMTGYTFSPASASISNISANLTANFAATAHATASITNTTRPGNNTNFYYGDAWQLVVTGPASQPVTYTSTKNGQQLGQQAPGSTNASGTFTLTGAMTGTNLLATYVEVWSVGGVAAPSLTFSVSGFTISGTITAGSSGVSGVTVTLAGTQSGTTTTDANGNFSFTVAPLGSYTITPSMAGHTFSPASATFNGIGANQTANFTTTLTTYTISGTVTAGSTGLSGATVTLSGGQSGSTTTNSSGAYSFSVASGGSYTVTPSMTGYTFSPASASFNNIATNQTANFTGTLGTYTISGTVTAGSSGLSGATVTLSGGQSGSTTTNSSGAYSFTVSAAASYTVTPSMTNYSFSPASTSVTNIAANQTANFTGTLKTYTISGTVTAGSSGLSGVTVTLSGGQSGSTTTNSSGAYSFTVQAGASYTVTPSMTGYTFSPASASFNNIATNQTANFTGTLGTYTISGTVTAGSSGLSGAAVKLSGGQSGSTTTNSSGAYSLTVQAGGSYTVTPSMTGYTFTPASTSFTSVSSNQTANFSATAQVTVSITNTTRPGNNTNFYYGDAWQIVVTGPASQPVTYTSTQNGQQLPPQAPGSTNTSGTLTLTGTMTGTGVLGTYVETWSVGGVAAPNLTLTVTGYTISGAITAGSAGVSGVTVTLSGTQSGTTTTAANGSFSFTVAPNGSYTITPSMTNHTFSPASIQVNNISGNQAAANFTSTIPPYTISGAVTTTAGGGLANVTVGLSVCQTSSTITDANGNYSLAVTSPGICFVTPSLVGYTFAPATQAFTNPAGNQVGANFTATGAPPTITGLSLGGPAQCPCIASLTGPPQMGFVINGTGFLTPQGNSTVTLNGTPLNVISWTTGSITVQVPSTATQATSGQVVVTVGNQSSTQAVTFTVIPTELQCAH